MSLTIELKDRNGNPLADHEIYVSYKGITGTHGKTNSKGLYDTGLNGTQTVEKITCYGRTLHNYSLPVDSNTLIKLKF